MEDHREPPRWIRIHRVGCGLVGSGRGTFATINSQEPASCAPSTVFQWRSGARRALSAVDPPDRGGLVRLDWILWNLELLAPGDQACARPEPKSVLQAGLHRVGGPPALLRGYCS